MIPEFTLYTRMDCGLCSDMRTALHDAMNGAEYRCQLVDIDDDGELRRLYGERVPVLAAAGRVLCEGRFDLQPLTDWMHFQARGSGVAG